MQYDTTKLTNYQHASINWDRIKKTGISPPCQPSGLGHRIFHP